MGVVGAWPSSRWRSMTLVDGGGGEDDLASVDEGSQDCRAKGISGMCCGAQRRRSSRSQRDSPMARSESTRKGSIACVCRQRGGALLPFSAVAAAIASNVPGSRNCLAWPPCATRELRAHGCVW